MNKKNGLLSSVEIKSILTKFGRRSAKVFNTQAEVEEYNKPFNECVFNYDVDFNENHFNEKASFYKSIFLGDVNFSNAIFNTTANFSKVLFLNYQDYNKSEDRRLLKLCFSNAIFNSVALFENTIFHNLVNFNGTKFNLAFNDIETTGKSLHWFCSFYKSQFKEECNFAYISFKGRTSFSSAIFNKKSDFSNSIFFDSIGFDIGKNETTIGGLDMVLTETIFKKKVVFYHRSFKNLILQNTRFEALADFYGVTFETDVHFHKTDFLDTCVFSQCTFKEKAVFHYTKIANNVILRGANFKNGLNLALLNFIGNGYLNTFDVRINKFKPSTDLKDVDEDKDSWRNISPIHKRETYRILKNESIKQSNRIEALKWHAREMESYKVEIKNRKKPLKLLISTKIEKTRKSVFSKLLKQFSDYIIAYSIDERIILFFNKWSNNYGQSWLRGFIFTILMSILFFTIYVPSLLEYNLDLSTKGLFEWYKIVMENIKYLPHMVNPTHPIDFMSKVNTNTTGLPLIVDSLARIFVGLGIYQTIQAFRKHGRW